MKIYLHIGTEKTGTTSIQSFLSQKRDILLTKKILYPKTLGFPNNVNLSIAFQNKNKVDDYRIRANVMNETKVAEYQKNLRNEFEREIQHYSPETLVVSNEHLSSRLNSVEEIKDIYDFFKPYSQEIKVVLYIRRQDTFMESRYSTAIKSGNTYDFVIPEKGNEQLDMHYMKLLDLWKSSFGKENIIIKIYEKNQLLNGDIVDDFLHTIQLPIKKDMKESKFKNVAFGIKKLEFLKYFNQYVPVFINHKPNTLRGNIVNLLEKVEINDFPCKISKNDKEDIFERFKDENREVNQQYLGNDDDLFEADTSNYDNKEEPVTNISIIEISSQLWVLKQKEYLSSFIANKLLRMEIFILKNNFEKAQELANNISETHPKHPRLLYLYALLYFKKEEFEMAMTYCQQAIEVNSTNPEFHELLKKIQKKS